MMKKLKNYFLAGLAAILPLWVTFLLVKIIVRAVISIPAGIVHPILALFPSVKDQSILIHLMSFIAAIILIIILGKILTNIIVRRLFMGMEKLIEKIPLLSWIYSAIRKLTELFLSEDSSKKLKRVVMLEYPRKNVYAIGFMTTECETEFNQKVGHEMINVFLPTTPNPTSGFLLMVPKNEVVFLDISTEAAVKLIVSGGMVSPSEKI